MLFILLFFLGGTTSLQIHWPGSCEYYPDLWHPNTEVDSTSHLDSQSPSPDREISILEGNKYYG